VARKAGKLSARTIRRVDELLAQAYGEKRVKPGDPLDGLVRTILSQNTTDKTSLPAFRSLKGKFPTWHKALAARPREIAAAIKRAGLAPTKSKRIHALLTQIKQQRGALSLAHVYSAEDTRAARSAKPRLDLTMPVLWLLSTSLHHCNMSRRLAL